MNFRIFSPNNNWSAMGPAVEENILWLIPKISDQDFWQISENNSVVNIKIYNEIFWVKNHPPPSPRIFAKKSSNFATDGFPNGIALYTVYCKQHILCCIHQTAYCNTRVQCTIYYNALIALVLHCNVTALQFSVAAHNALQLSLASNFFISTLGKLKQQVKEKHLQML